MSTKLWVIAFDESRFAEESPQHFSFGSAHHASPQELMAALIAEGGEITGTYTDHRNRMRKQPLYGLTILLEQPGRYLIYGPIPAEEETTT